MNLQHSQSLAKSTQQCRYFTSTNGCRFGEKCRNSHNEGTTQKQDNPSQSSHIKVDNAVPTICQDNTTEPSHNAEDPVKEHRDLTDQHEEKTDHKKSQRFCRFFMKGYCRAGMKCNFIHPWHLRKSRKKSETKADIDAQNDSKQGHATDKKQQTSERPAVLKPVHFNESLSDLSEESMKYLQKVEIDQVKKRFNDAEIVEQELGVICNVKMEPTDPDWPYDVKEVQLTVQFPCDYPKKIFEVEMADDGQFPNNFTQHVNHAIEKHLKEHEAAQQLRDTTDLLFRPFLRWLDRNLESLFTKALKQIKFDAEARSAGLEFVPFVEKDQIEHTKENEPRDIEIHALSVNEDATLDDKAKVPQSDTTESPDGTAVPHDDPTVPHDDPTVPENDPTVSPDDPTVSPDEPSAMFEMIQSKKTSSNIKKGTEVRFRGLELHENTATVRLTSLTFTVVCNRCKNRDEIPNVKQNTKVVVTCSKCSNAQSITLTSSELVHQHSSTVAFISPEGCCPLDLILTECHIELGCLNCSKETSAKGIHYGSTKNVWCHHCHQKLDLKIDSTRFHQVQQDQTADTDLLTVRVKKTARMKDPRIKSGEPLPSNGTCKHYKKSYRWMRFPCCGKCYPCDECHNENEDHEMERATRMICGFCAKEQAFTQKACTSCESDMTASHSSHWEGGKGCRNKIKMSRGDSKKYSEMEKTISRHATKVDSKKKRK